MHSSSVSNSVFNTINIFGYHLFRLNQTFSVSLPLPDLELTHLPILLSGFLTLLEEKVGSLGQNFLFSKSIFQQEISPFSFISLRLSPVSTSCSITGEPQPTVMGAFVFCHFVRYRWLFSKLSIIFIVVFSKRHHR